MFKCSIIMWSQSSLNMWAMWLHILFEWIILCLLHCSERCVQCTELFQLIGGGWPVLHPTCITPTKETRYLLCRRPCGSQAWSRWEWKISPPPGFDPRPIQPVAICYTDYALPVHNVVNFVGNSCKGRTFLMSINGITFKNLPWNCMTYWK